MLLDLLGNLDHRDPLGPLDPLARQDQAMARDLRYCAVTGYVVVVYLLPSEKRECDHLNVNDHLKT